MVKKAQEQLSLRFYEPGCPHAHTVPAIALAQSLDSLQRLIHLLAMRREGRIPNRRIRPSTEIQERYRLVCELPKPGSYLTPVRIEGHGLLGPTEIPVVIDELTNVLTAVGKASEADLEVSISDETWRRFALEALERLVPPPPNRRRTPSA